MTDSQSNGNEFLPPLTEDLQATPQWARSSSEAKQEEKEWGTTLDKTKRKNDNRWLICYGWIVVVITLLFALLFATALITWSIHYLTPWCWLDDDQLSKVQAVLFSGGMGAIISSIIKSQLDKTV